VDVAEHLGRTHIEAGRVQDRLEAARVGAHRIMDPRTAEFRSIV
jgi:hypothetical protein